MSTWTKAKLEDYAKLNKHELGRQEEMERQAAWFDLQAENENAKRQERSNRGQTLEMSRRTTIVPDTDLPIYLDAYLSLCATDSSVLRIDMSKCRACVLRVLLYLQAAMNDVSRQLSHCVCTAKHPPKTIS